MNRYSDIRTVSAALAALLVMMLVPSSKASAQRTMEGQNFIGADAIPAFTDARDFGARISWGMYGTDHRLEAWAAAVPGHRMITQDTELLYGQISAGCDWQWRLLSTRSRSFSLYAGGGALLGWETYDPFRKLPPHVETDLPGKGTFLYGCTASLETEIFLLRRLALVLRTDADVIPPSRTGILRLTAGMGLRVEL